MPYFRVNHAFKAVTIPSAGDWVVRFEYRPARWEASWLLAAAGCVMLAGLALLASSARRGRTASDLSDDQPPSA